MSVGFGSSPLEVLARDAMIQGLVYTDEFCYRWNWLPNTTSFLPPLGDITVSTNINSDSDFICQQMNFVVMTHTSPNQFVPVEHPHMLVTITRSGSGRNLMDGPVHVSNIFGAYDNTKSWPGQMPITSLYQGSSQISIRLQDLGAGDYDYIQLAMRGLKVFYQTNAAGQTGNRQDIFHAL